MPPKHAKQPTGAAQVGTVQALPTGAPQIPGAIVSGANVMVPPTVQLPTPLPAGAIGQASESVLVAAMPETVGRAKRGRSGARKKPLPPDALPESMDPDAGPAPQQEDGDSDVELPEDASAKKRKPQLEYTQIDGDDTAYRVRHAWTDDEVVCYLSLTNFSRI